MIIFNGIDLIILVVGGTLLTICGILLAVDRIAYAVKKCKQKRRGKMFKEEGEE
jgi:hypothetical protein